MRPRLDAGRLASALRGLGAPLIAEIHALDPSRAQPSCEALYDVLLEVVGRDLDLRYPVILDVLAQSGLAPILLPEPRRVLAMLVNATVRVTSIRHDSAERWPSEVARVASIVRDRPATFGDALAIAAWESGVPMLREAALTAVSRLPAAIARALLRAPDEARSVPGIVSRLREDEWSSPSRIARRDPPSARLLSGVLGGHRGLGGPFSCLPRAEALGGRLYICEGERRFLVWADRFGLALEPCAVQGKGRPGADEGGLVLLHDGRVSWPAGSSAAPLVTPPIASWASIERTLIAIPERSFRVVVIGLAEST